MVSGIHSHYCTKHGARYECAKVTHCKQPAETVCHECLYAEMTGECAVCGSRVMRDSLKERRNAGGRIEMACPECLKTRPSLEDETRAVNEVLSTPREYA